MSPATQKAIVLTEVSNNLDGIKYTDVEIPEVGPDDILIKNKYAAVNYVDISFRKGVYPVPEFPFILGAEALGVVSAVGSNVKNYSVGDKVAYIGKNAYSQYIKLKSDFISIAKINNDVSEDHFKLYGSVASQVLTALVLVEEAHKVEAGQNILVWAAAGGVGQTLTQLISTKGANVIAVASTPEKLSLAKSLGAKYLINGLTDDVGKKVQEFTNGQGVDAVYDAVGKETFDVSFGALAKTGTFVTYGGITGSIEDLQVAQLESAGIKLARPALFASIGVEEKWKALFDQLKEIIKAGSLKLEASQTFPLSEYAKAITALEKRETTGKLTLTIPQ